MSKTYNKIDLHMHSILSDGTDTPEKIVSEANRQGIELFSLTDHDEIKGCADIIKMTNRPDFVTGVEFSCVRDRKKYHILGYGYDVNAKPIQATVEKTHNSRIDKIYEIFSLLRIDYGMTFEKEEIDDIFCNNNPGKPHVANLMVEKGYFENTTDAFVVLNKLKTSIKYLSPEQAIEAVLASGGVPVLAHGVLEDGRGNLNYDEMLARVRALKDAGLMGLECYYSTFTKEQHEIMMRIAREENLLITAGSDYHGSNKKIALGNVGLASPPSDEINRFLTALGI